MKYILFLVIAVTILFSSCSKDLSPVFEVYITFENAQEYDQIQLQPSHISYGWYDTLRREPTGNGDIIIDRSKIIIHRDNFLKKTFVTSAESFFTTIDESNNKFLSLNFKLELYQPTKYFELWIDKSKNIFPVDFKVENGEAYEIIFIFDLKNSLHKNGTALEFLAGGNSRVEIKKY